MAFGAAKPSPLFPDLPVVNGTLPDFKISNWFGVVGPGRAVARVDRRSGTARSSTVAKQPKFIQLMTDNGMEILAGSPEEFKATIEADRSKWSDVIQRRRSAWTNNRIRVDLPAAQTDSDPIAKASAPCATTQ